MTSNILLHSSFLKFILHINHLSPPSFPPVPSTCLPSSLSTPVFLRVTSANLHRSPVSWDLIWEWACHSTQTGKMSVVLKLGSQTKGVHKIWVWIYIVTIPICCVLSESNLGIWQVKESIYSCSGLLSIWAMFYLDVCEPLTATLLE